MARREHAPACPGSTATADRTGAGAKASDITIAVAGHGRAGDAFWSSVERGARKAGDDLGVTVTYLSGGDPRWQARLVDAAVGRKPDGLVVSMADPDALAGTRPS